MDNVNENTAISNRLMTHCYIHCSSVFLYYLQYMSEKIGGAKGTELDDDFVEMERVSSLSNIS